MKSKTVAKVKGKARVTANNVIAVVDTGQFGEVVQSDWGSERKKLRRGDLITISSRGKVG